MMAAVDLDARGLHEAGQVRTGVDLDGVADVVGVCTGVALGRVVVEVLDDFTAAGDVGELVTKADSQDGDAALVGAAEEVQLEAVAAGMKRFGLWMERCAPVRRIEIVTAGEQYAGDAIQQGIETRVVVVGQHG